MSSVVLTFLGGFDVVIDDRPATNFATHKTRALLAYLALEPARPHTRSELAALFWPETHDRHARVNLRNTLYRLRSAVDAITPKTSDQILTVTRQDVRFNSTGAFVDAHEFQMRVDATSTHAHRSLSDCSVCLAHLKEASDLYHGELLAGLDIADAAPFEEWLLLRRELLFHQALRVLTNLSDMYESQGATDSAHGYAVHALNLDPYREETHRRVMRLCAHQGLPDQALAQYDTLRRLLREELDVEPNEETAELARRISSGELGKTVGHQNAPALPVAPLPQPDWSAAPLVSQFFGRTAELAQLEQWLVHDRCRMIAVLGIGGMGKTTLAAHSVRALAERFDTVIWRSLLNAPKLEEILPSILQILSNQQLSELPDLLDEQLALLYVYLSKHRVLLVLDNLESILDAQQAGAFRTDYHTYGQLMRQMATRDHRSHLLLTSRERPQGFVRLERDSPLVQSLRLGGLDQDAGKELLQLRGIAGSKGEEAVLVHRYSGNPLALKLVADTVHELFAGDVAGFLTDETLVFDDVRTVLDQQFRRLSPLEQEVLFWLAVEREPISVSTLRADLLRPPSVRVLLEALRALQRRSLIEQQDGGFVLQNVVIEYLTDRLIQAAIQELESNEMDLLHRHALLKAESKEYVRLSQARLILDPIGQHLFDRFDRSVVSAGVQPILSKLRSEPTLRSGYVGGNILNLMLHLGIDVTGSDFSHLGIRQAYLQDTTLTEVDFTGADLSQSVFTDDFSSVFAVAISPDGGLLAAGTDNGDIRLWQLTGRKPQGLLKTHTNRVLSVVFSPDGRLLASAGMDQVIRIWDVESGHVIKTMNGHRGGIRSVAISPDGELLASASQDHTVRVWSIRSGLLIATLGEHTDWVNGVAFHPSGELLATGGHDRTICLWSVPAIVVQTAEGENHSRDALLATLHGHSDTVVVLAFSPDGSLLASSGAEGPVLLWDVETQHTHMVLHGHSHWVRGLTFNREGTVLASGDADGTVRLWDIPSGRGMNTLANSDQVWDLAMSPDGETLACGGLDGAIYLWDLRTQWRGRAYSMLRGYVAPVGAVAFSPDGHTLATADEGKGWVRLRELDHTGLSVQQTRLLAEHTAVVRSLDFSPDGNILATVSEDRTVRLWDASSGKSLDVLYGHALGLHCVAFDVSGKIVASAGDDCTIHLWDVSVPGQGQLINVLHGHTGPVHAVVFSPARGLLASVSADSTVRLWNPRTGACIQILDEYAQDFWSIAFCPDAVTLAVGGRDRLIRLWDIRDLEHVKSRATLEGHIGNVLDLEFSPLGSVLASASEDGSVGLWHVPRRERLRTLHGEGQSVMSVAFRPDGKVLASGGFDGATRLWDPASGEQLRKLRPPGPYEGMKITGVTGITNAQKAALAALGAVDESATHVKQSN